MPFSADIIPRPEHCISRAEISDNALRVLYRLKNAGFESFLVGGGVRDLLLGLHPKDFDIATDAHPEQVKELFRNCRLIGRRFRLAHVYFSGETIEVATFRALNPEANEGDTQIVDGQILRDNVYGTLDEDAMRRDFTVNSLYYNITDFSVVDYNHGMQDIEQRLLRLIGDTEQRLREDPVRMLRAVRFSAKLNFHIAPEIVDKMPEMAGLLANIPPARLFDEMLKLFHAGHAVQTFELLEQHQLLLELFPALRGYLDDPDASARHLLLQALQSTDERVRNGQPVTPAFLIAALLWAPMQALQEDMIAAGLSASDALHKAAAQVISEQTARVSLPRRFSQAAREIWALQPRLERNTGKRPLRLVTHPRFRAAYDFLVLRGHAGEPVVSLAEWWTSFQEKDEEAREAMLGAAKKKKRRRRRRRKPSTDKDS